MSFRARLFCLVVLSAVADLALAGPCLADPFGGAAPVGAETLQSERGGFFAANGLEFGFAATMQTVVNGAVALTTTLVLQDDGSVSRQTTVNPSLPLTVVNNPADLAAATAGTGLNLNGLQGVGAVIKTASGVTAVLDNATTTQLENLVINTANGQAISQNTTVTLTLPPSTISPAGMIMSGLTSALQFSQVSGGFH